YGFRDRGTLAPGLRADVNVIDLARLELKPPVMVADLPAGGQRLFQRARGYRATLVAGDVTIEHDEPTRALPGRLLRGGQGCAQPPATPRSAPDGAPRPWISAPARRGLRGGRLGARVSDEDRRRPGALLGLGLAVVERIRVAGVGGEAAPAL